ncbi:MAG: glutamine-hydrolyzing carbamoyl-phosphate synthase small subunit [Acidobacteria bacterium]|nr:glutamine-hydrolyzing carbamoyl-phosphate synthase small subunit [Acidobacteriota bacterium]MCB9397242.1 glutamine-hydrolyzing carbamoyl-phosphate synthase small subunit [Acidobacteriota bacterium]
MTDGTRLDGLLLGARARALGELVFNTSVVGYQEILTDPSYHGQIVVLTQPEIGNYGVHENACESYLGRAAGLVFRSLSPQVYHPESEMDLDAYLRSLDTTAICEVDTRYLTRKLRDGGAQNAALFPAAIDTDQARAYLAGAPNMVGASLAPLVSTPRPVEHGSGSKHVVLVDFGIKLQTIKQLVQRGCRVTQVPWNTPFNAIQALNPDGILLSNGPGDPDAVPGVREVVARLMDHYPVMGICLGYQIMALALGGTTYKLPFGHRGGNHPVKDRISNRVFITAQNHGFAVDEESMKHPEIEITHHSLFDGSLEGFRLKERPVFGVQFHPEAAPGPRDCQPLFDQFLTLMGEGTHA